MKEYFTLMADYNARTNGAMYEIARKLSPELRIKSVGSYFKSLEGVLVHLYNSDFAWLRRFHDNLPHLHSLESRLLEGEMKSFTDPMFPNFATLSERRTQLDSLIIAFVAESGDRDYARAIQYVNSAGAQKRFHFWQALVHMFTHQTHHRGQVAEILDEFGIANDYSNISAMLPTAP